MIESAGKSVGRLSEGINYRVQLLFVVLFRYSRLVQSKQFGFDDSVARRIAVRMRVAIFNAAFA